MGIELLYLLFVWIIIWSWLSNRSVTYHNRRLICGHHLYGIVVFGLMGVLMCFRSVDVGADTYAYAVNIYHNIISVAPFNEVFSFDGTDMLSYEFSKAPLYWRFFWIICIFSDEPSAYIFVGSLIFMIGLVSFIYRSKVNIIIAALVFLLSLQYFLAFNIMRQFISIVFCANAFLYLFQSLRSGKGWLLYVMGVMIHPVSAIFALAILGAFLARRYSIMRLVTISILTAIGVVTLLFVVMKLFVIYTENIQYATYFIDNGGDNFLGANNKGTGMAVIGQASGYLGVAILYIYIMWKRKLDEKGTLGYAILPSTIVFSVVWLILREVPMIDRILMVFQVLEIVFIPYVLNLYPLRQRMILYFISILGLASYATVIMGKEGMYGIFPYTIGL